MMDTWAAFGSGLAAFGATLLLTAAVRRHAIVNQMLDHPNERSSHSTPTPRGAGLAIVVVVITGLLGLGMVGSLDWMTVSAIGGGAVVVAWVGWLDDRRSLPAHTRLTWHFFAAAWTVVWLRGMPSLSLGGSEVALGIFGALLAIIGLVWATNLFNFMDGIDGLVGIEAVFIGGIGGILLLTASSAGLGTFALIITGACLAFLYWNWAPAKIFLGDVGSGFLGFVFAAVAVSSENSKALPVLAWAILAAVFIVDATITFVRRFRAGFWRQAHRSHAYQRAVQSGYTHANVSGAIAVANLGLGFLAMAAFAGIIPLVQALLLAFALVAALYAWIERLEPFRIHESAVPKSEASQKAGIDIAPRSRSQAG